MKKKLRLIVLKLLRVSFFFLLGSIIGDLYFKETDKSILSSIGLFDTSNEEMISSPYEIEVKSGTEILKIKFLLSTKKQDVYTYLNENRNEIMRISNDYFYNIGSEKIRKMELNELSSGLTEYIENSIKKSIYKSYITEFYPIN